MGVWNAEGERVTAREGDRAWKPGSYEAENHKYTVSEHQKSKQKTEQRANIRDRRSLFNTAEKKAESEDYQIAAYE